MFRRSREQQVGADIAAARDELEFITLDFRKEGGIAFADFVVGGRKKNSILRFHILFYTNALFPFFKRK